MMDQSEVTSAYSPDQGLLISIYYLIMFNKNLGFREISVDELKEKINKSEIDLIIDVRGINEFKLGHVPKAKNIPLDNLTLKNLEENNMMSFKDKSVAVICGIGKRSAQAAVRLTKVLLNN